MIIKKQVSKISHSATTLPESVSITTVVVMLTLFINRNSTTMNSNEMLYRTTRLVWYIFYVIETVLLLRFGLKMLGANPGATFTQFVYDISGVFIAPFRYVFNSPAVYGSVVELGTLLALFVYWLLAWGIVKLIVMNRDVNQYEAKSSLENQDNA